MGVKATTIAVTAILLLGGLYLYMNRFEYLNVGMLKPGRYDESPIFLRINKLTGMRCVGARASRAGGRLARAAVLQSPWECGESFIKDKIIKR